MSSRTRSVSLNQCLVVILALGAACAHRQSSQPRATLADRPCPTQAQLEAARLPAPKHPDDIRPQRGYITYLLDGRIVAANLRQDSMSYYEKTYREAQEFAATVYATPGELKPYAPNTAPAEWKVCPGVGALNFRRK